jgi:hypothetical protein
MAEEFGKFIGILLGLKSEGKWAELEQVINTSSKKYTNIEIELAEQLENENLVENLINNHQLNESNLKMLADLLYEKGIGYGKLFRETESGNSFFKALVIYEHVKNNSNDSDFSLDMHFKMEALRQLLNK